MAAVISVDMRVHFGYMCFMNMPGGSDIWQHSFATWSSGLLTLAMLSVRLLLPV